jgi:hypothetical protein
VKLPRDLSGSSSVDGGGRGRFDEVNEHTPRHTSGGGGELTAAMEQFGLQALAEIYQRVDVGALQEGATVHSRADWSRLADDPVMRGSVSAILLAHRSRRRSADVILSATMVLRDQVEAAAR